MNPIDKAIKALEGSIKLIGREVISNVMPKEQEANYEALQALRSMQEVDVKEALKFTGGYSESEIRAYYEGGQEMLDHLIPKEGE